MGWALCPVPAGSKGPNTAGWNLEENAITAPEQITGNVGLLHAYSGTCAVDVDNYEKATVWLSERGVNLQTLMEAPDAVAINSPNPYHAKLLYALPPFAALPSVKVVLDGKTILELRCATADGKSVQDVLPPSMHPMGQPYRWGGKGRPDALPALPQAIADLWQSMVREQSEPEGEPTPAAEVNVDELNSALNSIDPDCDHDTWVKTGMGVHHALPNAIGLKIWNDWSARSETKYPGAKTIVNRWKSFDDSRPNGVTVASVYSYAMDAGWERPMPDVEKLFKPIPVPEGEAKPTPESVEVKLTGRIVSPPTVDTSLWPPILVRRAEEVAAEVGCDVIVPLSAGLCALSGVTDKRSTLTLNPTWKVPPTVWMMTIGEPADKKTPGSKPMILPLRTIEREDHDRYTTEMLLWQGKEARYASQLKIYKDWEASEEASMPNSVPPKVDPLPPAPEPLRLVVSDATTQKIVTMSEHRPRGFLLYLDEMNRWLTKIGDTRSTDDRGTWVQGYETGAFVMDRMGSGTTMVENMGLSIYGNCQPAVFRENVKTTSTDGIIQRFMPVVIDSAKNTMWQKALPDFMSFAGEYEQLIRQVYMNPVRDYALDDDAMAVFRSFCAWTLRLRANEQLLSANPTYQTALGKIEGNFGRVLMMFHIIENRDSLTIGAELVSRVVQLFKTFIVPSLRYTFIEVGQQSDPLMRRVFDVITQWSSAKEKITMGELRNAVKASADSREPWKVDQLLRAIMDELEAQKYVAVFQDHPRHPVWLINPNMATMFKDYRKKLINAKQDRLEMMLDGVEQRKGVKITNRQKATGYTGE